MHVPADCGIQAGRPLPHSDTCAILTSQASIHPANLASTSPPIPFLACRRLAAANAAKVFVTDNIVTTLMCIRSSIYSWDIVVTRTGDKLFLDLRPDSNLNMLTVNETAPEAVPEDKDNMNGVQQLGVEATACNQNFSQQVGPRVMWRAVAAAAVLR
jgi:hypothetical protein